MKKIIERNKANSVISTQVKASVAYTVCSIIQKCLSLITVSIFARLLTEEEYGLSVVYTSVMNLIIIFTSLELPFGSFSTAMTKFEEHDKYVSSLNGLCTILMLGYYGIYLWGHEFWDNLFKLPSALMIIMGAEMLFSTAKAFWLGQNRFELKYKNVIFVTIFQTVLTVCLSVFAVLIVKTGKGFAKVIVGSCIEIVIGFVIYLNSIVKGKTFFEKRYWIYALKFNIPLIPYYLSQMIFNQSDRIMIDHLIGRREAALYGVGYNLSMILMFVLNSINNSYIPWMYTKIKNNEYDENKKLSIGLILFIGISLLAFIAIGPELLFIMGGKKYISANGVITPIACSMLLLFYSQLFTCVMFYYEDKFFLVFGSIIAALINIILNYLYIPKFGFVAAAYTTLISYFVFCGFNYIGMLYSLKKHGICFKIYDTKKLLVILFFFFLIAFGLSALYDYRYVRYLICFAGIVLAYVNKNKILKAVNFYLSIFR